MTTQKSHEQRVRREAARQGLLLRRNRVRKPTALGYGLYLLFEEVLEIRDPELGYEGTGKAGEIVFGLPHGRTLEEVEAYLLTEGPGWGRAAEGVTHEKTGTATVGLTASGSARLEKALALIDAELKTRESSELRIARNLIENEMLREEATR
jgi:hypothetical protein